MTWGSLGGQYGIRTASTMRGLLLAVGSAVEPAVHSYGELRIGLSTASWPTIPPHPIRSWTRGKSTVLADRRRMRRRTSSRHGIRPDYRPRAVARRGTRAMLGRCCRWRRHMGPVRSKRTRASQLSDPTAHHGGDAEVNSNKTIDVAAVGGRIVPRLDLKLALASGSPRREQFRRQLDVVAIVSVVSRHESQVATA